MSTPQPLAPGPDVSLQSEGVPGSRRTVRRFLSQLWRQVVVEPIAEGRLRDVGWPIGLRVVVTAVHVALVLGTLLVLLAEPLRAVLPLTMVGEGVAIPRAIVGVLLLLVSLAMSTFLLACAHGPRWLLVVGLVIGIPLLFVMGIFTLVGTTGPTLMTVPVTLDVAAIVVFVLVWRRRGPGRWQFPILYGLVLGQFLLVAADAASHSVPLGFDPLPAVVALQIGLLGPVASPLIFAAGTAPAEVTINLSLRAASLLGKGFRRSVTYTAMVAVLLVAAGQTGWLLVQDSAFALPWQTWVSTAAALLGWVAIVLWSLAPPVARWRSIDVGEVGSSLGWVAGAVLLGSIVPLFAVLLVLMMLAVVVPGLDWSYTALQRGGSVAALRGTAIVAALVAAWWSRRRGHPVRASVLGCAAVALLPYVLTPLLDLEQAFTIDLTLVAAAVIVTVVTVTVALVVRGRLSETRAVAVLAIAVLVAMVPHRSILAEPLEFLLGPGVGLILLGLWWQLLSESEVANGDSRSFPLTSRVLLLLTATLLTVIVLAYNVLSRQPAVGGMQQMVTLGDDTLGMAMLAAAGGGLLVDLARDRLPATEGGLSAPGGEPATG